MDKNLNFLTKTLVEQAVIEINKKGIPPKREGIGYAVLIGDEKYPFKLIVTEAAKIASIDLNAKDFTSSETNRNGFQKSTGYPIIILGEEMEYFNLEQIASYKNELGKKYDTKSKGAICYNDTRSKLHYLGARLSEFLNVDLVNNYNEKPNKMAGKGKGFVLKEYILTGFLPAKYKENGNQIFIKLSFGGFRTQLCFSIDIDVNFSDENNEFNKYRKALQKKSYSKILIEENFPTTWEDLLDTISPIFEKQLKTIDEFFSEKTKTMDLLKLINILNHKKQIILQGPPGTGKTYSAKDLAELQIFNSISSDKKEQKRRLEESGQFSLVQFHPSFSYEDFVRGISAKSIDGNIIYEAENKIMASFAEKAHYNQISASKELEELSKEQQIEKLIFEFSENIAAEISEHEVYKITDSVSILNVEEDAFRYSGKWETSQRMKFKDLIFAQLNNVKTRQELRSLHGVSGLAKQHASYFIKVLNTFQDTFKKELEKDTEKLVAKPQLQNFVLIIDEINRANLPSVLGELIYALEYRNEVVQSIYAIDGDNSLIIPDNLYIIGTMNTADRSVGHIDYAIKRRFSFIDVLPNEEVIKTAKAKELFNIVTKLFVKEGGKRINSDFLASDFDYKEVQLGHSYFLLKDGTDEEQKIELQMRLKYEIVPILNEYMKDGLLLESAKDEIEKIAKFEC